MKKKTIMKTILSLTLVAFLLCGCGNSTDATTTSEDMPEEVVEPVEAPDTEEKEEVTEPKEKEELKQEEVMEEILTEMPEAQVTTTVADITEFVQYMASLDPTTPHIVIWNETGGYVIDMGEGEYYQLKKDDRIFTNLSENIRKHSYKLPRTGTRGITSAMEIIPNYSEFEKPQETMYKIYTDSEDEGILLTCYLDAPVE